MSLRNLENAIQMLGNEQIHILPAAIQARENIMTLLGENDWEGYCRKIETIRRFVNGEFQKFFETDSADSHVSSEFEDNLNALLPVAKHMAQNWLDGQFPHSATNEKFQSLGQALLEQIFKSSAISDDAIIRINQFFQALSRSEQYLFLLSRNQNLLDTLIPPLLYSPHMTRLLEQSPHIIDVFLSPQVEPDPSFIFQSDDYETRLERLRRFVNENLFLYYTTFLSEGGNGKNLHRQLTALADMTIEAALKVVADDLQVEHLPLTVLGLGKMGTSRMAPLSDVDLVFIFEDGADSELCLLYTSPSPRDRG